MAFARPLQGRADCTANFDLIRSWISQCDRHPICTRVPSFASDFRLPTRFIDIESGPDGRTPRLISSSNLDETADRRYVALTHCWGDPGKVPKTLRDTIADHEQKITQLSKTFQDAIEVTRQIGVRYLWIDSLCIIQDESSDFEIECAKMNLIYARAYCVVSAQDAKDGNDGLFIPRSSTVVPPIDFSCVDWTAMLAGPVSRRGWTFQEHQLAPRIIHFTKSRIMWECRVCIASEDSPAQVYRAFVGDMRQEANNVIWRLFDGRHERYDHISDEQSLVSLGRNDLHTRWLRAAELYSSRHLTFDDDRLPAISGLAAAVHSILRNDVYLAGIWQNDILRGLLWVPVQHDTRVESEKNPSLPSWSWASYNGQVQFLTLAAADKETWPKGMPKEPYDSYVKDFMPKVGENSATMRASTTTTGLDPFGRVSGGLLHLKALAKDCTIHVSRTIDLRSNCQILDVYDDRFRILLDCGTVESGSKVVLAALICGGEKYGVRKSFFRHAYGLVLKKSTSRTFSRIGAFAQDVRKPGECGDDPNMASKFFSPSIPSMMDTLIIE